MGPLRRVCPLPARVSGAEFFVRRAHAQDQTGTQGHGDDRHRDTERSQSDGGEHEQKARYGERFDCHLLKLARRHDRRMNTGRELTEY